MFNTEDYVVYKKNVCKIKELKQIKDKEYYVLEPIDDKSLLITIPTNLNSNLIRNIISKEEAENLINEIPHIGIIESNNKQLESEYKDLLNSGKLEDLVKIIKTTYLRNNYRLNNHKKISEKDDNYFNKAEKLLYNELSISLGIKEEEVKNYISKKVAKL